MLKECKNCKELEDEKKILLNRIKELKIQLPDPTKQYIPLYKRDDR